jgi:hypothetical protein
VNAREMIRPDGFDIPTSRGFISSSYKLASSGGLEWVTKQTSLNNDLFITPLDVMSDNRRSQ